MPQATFSLAKSIHYTHFSIAYLEDVIVTAQLWGDNKQFIKRLIDLQKKVLRELYTRMPADSAELLRQEIEGRDIASIDSILNLVIALPEEKRLELETLLEEMSKHVNQVS